MSALLGGFAGRVGPLATIVLGISGMFVLALPAVGQSPALAPDDASAVSAEATQEALFADFLHYAKLGRFALADKYAQALLSRDDLDPIAVMKEARRDRTGLNTLLTLVENSSIGDSASQVLRLIEKGEQLQKQDPELIRANIEQLGGNPQQEFFAIRHLVESGEYAVAPMIQTLLDPAEKGLWPRVINALTKLGKPAVRPLVMALRMRNNDARLHVIHALGEIGYPQAAPYLARLASDEQMSDQTRKAAASAIARLSSLSGIEISGTPAQLFLSLAERFYDEDDAVRADARLDQANVWYWDDDDDLVKATVVVEPIFGLVMAMRCCEEALLLRNNFVEANALWLAANIRRESRLGLNVESGDPDEQGGGDETRPPGFPRALYFSQAAGPRYAHLVLDRAVRDGDTAVALGAIQALRITAGPSSLLGAEDHKQPLVQALHFPDILVRIRAALALGAALPRSPFDGVDLVVPTLATAVSLEGHEQVLVVDADQGNLNRVADAVRQGDRAVIAETGFFRGMARARAEFQTLSAVFLSTDSAEPSCADAVAQLRAEFIHTNTPVVLLVKPTHELLARELAQHDPFLEAVNAGADDSSLQDALRRVQARSGRSNIDTDMALSLALESVDTLRRIAIQGRTVFDPAPAEPALLAALSANDEELQIKAASVLAMATTPTAQQGIARVALNANYSDSLRMAAFRSLADSAKIQGNALTEDQIADLLVISKDDNDLTMRTAASQALGAINLATNQASEIIRSFHGG